MPTPETATPSDVTANLAAPQPAKRRRRASMTSSPQAKPIETGDVREKARKEQRKEKSKEEGAGPKKKASDRVGEKARSPKTGRSSGTTLERRTRRHSVATTAPDDEKSSPAMPKPRSKASAEAKPKPIEPGAALDKDQRREHQNRLMGLLQNRKFGAAAALIDSLHAAGTPLQLSLRDEDVASMVSRFKSGCDARKLRMTVRCSSDQCKALAQGIAKALASNSKLKVSVVVMDLNADARAPLDKLTTSGRFTVRYKPQ
jgi:hypothetical protein